MATVTGTKRHLAITSTTYDSSGDVVVGGNLTVEGTTTTLDTANLLVEDKNIIIGNVSTPSDTTADGGGITLKGASDYTINWINANNRWEFNQGIYSSGPITSAGEIEGASLDINGIANITGTLTLAKVANAAWLTTMTNTSVSGHGLLIQAGGTTGTRYITQWKDALAGTERFHMDDTGEAYFQSTIAASNLSGTNTGDQDLTGYLLNTTDVLDGYLSVVTKTVAAGGTYGQNIIRLVGTSQVSSTNNTVTPTNELILKPAMPAGYGTDGYALVWEQQSGANRTLYYRTSGAGALSLNVEGTVIASNLSGTNTGDETKARINALDITELGTISSGVWQGSAISQTYLTGQSGTNTGDHRFKWVLT